MLVVKTVNRKGRSTLKSQTHPKFPAAPQGALIRSWLIPQRFLVTYNYLSCTSKDQAFFFSVPFASGSNLTFKSLQSLQYFRELIPLFYFE